MSQSQTLSLIVSQSHLVSDSLSLSLILSQSHLVSVSLWLNLSASLCSVYLYSHHCAAVRSQSDQFAAVVSAPHHCSLIGGATHNVASSRVHDLKE